MPLAFQKGREVEALAILTGPQFLNHARHGWTLDRPTDRLQRAPGSQRTVPGLDANEGPYVVPPEPQVAAHPAGRQDAVSHVKTDYRWGCIEEFSDRGRIEERLSMLEGNLA
jgi:hypothetical protein